MNSCCQKDDRVKKDRGFLRGMLYGIMPHTFCIAFIVFTILGTTVMTSFLRPFLLNPYFFHILIGLSFFFATISAIIYLKRNGRLSTAGLKRSWKYLSIIYGTTIAVNLILFMVIFPLAANINLPTLNASVVNSQEGNSETAKVVLGVQIPCSGHAPLITTELNKIQGVVSVKFRLPNIFDVVYDPDKTSKNEIMSLEVFKTYKANVIE